MKVKAPNWITETTNLDDQLFICFMYNLALDHGFRVAYYLHIGDLSIFFKNKANLYIGNPTVLQNTTKNILLGKVNSKKVRIQFLKDKHQEIEWQIQGEKHKAIWLYLQGVSQSRGFINEESHGMRQTWRKHRLPMDVRAWLCNR